MGIYFVSEIRVSSSLGVVTVDTMTTCITNLKHSLTYTYTYTHSLMEFSQNVTQYMSCVTEHLGRHGHRDAGNVPWHTCCI